MPNCSTNGAHAHTSPAFPYSRELVGRFESPSDELIGHFGGDTSAAWLWRRLEFYFERNGWQPVTLTHGELGGKAYSPGQVRRITRKLIDAGLISATREHGQAAYTYSMNMQAAMRLPGYRHNEAIEIETRPYVSVPLQAEAYDSVPSNAPEAYDSVPLEGYDSVPLQINTLNPEILKNTNTEPAPAVEPAPASEVSDDLKIKIGKYIDYLMSRPAAERAKANMQSNFKTWATGRLLPGVAELVEQYGQPATEHALEQCRTAGANGEPLYSPAKILEQMAATCADPTAGLTDDEYYHSNPHRDDKPSGIFNALATGYLPEADDHRQPTPAQPPRLVDHLPDSAMLLDGNRVMLLDGTMLTEAEARQRFTKVKPISSGDWAAREARRAEQYQRLVAEGLPANELTLAPLADDQLTVAPVAVEVAA